MEAFKNGTESLRVTVEKLSENHYDKDLEDIEKTLTTMKYDYRKIMKTSKYDINVAMGDLYRAKSELHSLNIVLNILANNTISKVDNLVKSLGKFETASENKEVEPSFRRVVKNMRNLLSRSNLNLNQALQICKDLTERLISLKTMIDTFRDKIDDYIQDKDGKLTKDINKFRLEGHLSGGVCILFPPSCAFVFAASAAGIEVTINNWKSYLKKEREELDGVRLATKKLVGHVENGKEDNLIRYWKTKVEDVEEELPVTNILVQDIKQNSEGIEDLKKYLNELRKACTNYIAQSMPL